MVDKTKLKGKKDQVYQAVKMILAKSGKIYYVMSEDDDCFIMEIDPKHDNEHTKVFEIKSSYCCVFEAEKLDESID